MKTVEGWKISSLISLLHTMKSGGTPDTSRAEYYGGAIPFVSIEDMTACRKHLSFTAKTITNEGLRKSNSWMVPPYAILYSIYATLGLSRINNAPVATNQAILALINDPRKIDRDYLYYWLEYIRHRIFNFSSQTTQSNLSASIVKSFSVVHPIDLSEQALIAEVLSTVDWAIEQTEALIAKQQSIKTGLMQDLLTRGIDEHGNLRSEKTHKFKDSPLGRIPVEWEVRKIHETGSITLGRQLAPKYMIGKTPTPYLRVANVFDGWIDFDDILEMDFSPREKENFFLRSGDILLNEGQSLELVGRSSAFSGPDDVFCFQNTLIRYRAFKGILPTYARAVFKWWLDTGAFQEVSRQTTSVAHLGADRFGQMLFLRPLLNEQERIAEIILAHESQLKAQQGFRAKLRSLKTGLMQDLLTGKKRISTLMSEKDGI